MKTIRTLVIVCAAFFAFAFSCEENENMESVTPLLTGKWQVYERGYSPGAGYITEAVPARPEQTITFSPNNRFSSNISGIKSYEYYRILKDESNQQEILALFKADPGNAPVNQDEIEHSYTIEFTDNKLKLSFRWCFEGCHIGLVKK